MDDDIDNVNFRLEKTCHACPEQYDAFLNDKRVGYLRLRHGHFTVSYPDVGGELLFDANPKGDGIFDEEEREFYLIMAMISILNKLKGEKIA